MAISDTMSSPSNWMQFYRRPVAGQETPPPQGTSMFGGVSDATVVTTTVTSVSTMGSGNSSTSSGVHLNPDGRVSKPSRRRSRASRRAPTTLLNTDTANFRAMVQQFTGAPSAPFTNGSQTAAPNFNFGLGVRQHNLNPTAIMVPPGYHLPHEQQQYHHQQQQHQQQFQQQQQQQQQQFLFSMNNNNEVFLPRISNSNPRPSIEMPDGFLMDSIFHPRPS